MVFDRRSFVRRAVAGVALCLGFIPVKGFAKDYLTVEQAKAALWPGATFTKVPVTFTEAQIDAIQDASKEKVRSETMDVWRTGEGGWFILDQVIGKHENIDLAIALNVDGTVKGLEVLTYRESYGHEIMNPKWRAQFTGRDSSKLLKLDRDIQNIGGATLSCRHVTDGINRLVHTWEVVLRHLAQ